MALAVIVAALFACENGTTTGDDAPFVGGYEAGSNSAETRTTPLPYSTATPDPTGTPDPVRELCRAVTWGNVGLVEQLIVANTDVGSIRCRRMVEYYPSESPLFIAIIEAEAEVVQILVDAGVDVNAKDSDGDPLIYTAIRKGESEVVQILVEAGADVNAKDGDGNPLLYKAIREGKPEIVRILVDAGADAHASDSDGDLLLYTAIREGKPEIVRILVDAGADAQRKRQRWRPASLHGCRRRRT